MATVLRCLARTSKLAVNKHVTENAIIPCSTAISQIQKRSYQEQISPNITNTNKIDLPEFEISHNPDEWRYVERILPIEIIPKPKKFDGPFPSGWTPPKEEAKSLPYFVPRTKNHMQPVYLVVKQKGATQITIIKKIQGDIVKMEEDVRKFLQENAKKNNFNKLVASRINEMSNQISFKGDYVAYIKLWMNTKGF